MEDTRNWQLDAWNQSHLASVPQTKLSGARSPPLSLLEPSEGNKWLHCSIFSTHKTAQITAAFGLKASSMSTTETRTSLRASATPLPIASAYGMSSRPQACSKCGTPSCTWRQNNQAIVHKTRSGVRWQIIGWVGGKGSGIPLLHAVFQNLGSCFRRLYSVLAIYLSPYRQFTSVRNLRLMHKKFCHKDTVMVSPMRCGGNNRSSFVCSK